MKNDLLFHIERWNKGSEVKGDWFKIDKIGLVWIFEGPEKSNDLAKAVRDQLADLSKSVRTYRESILVQPLRSQIRERLTEKPLLLGHVVELLKHVRSIDIVKDW